jgi:hypothetical protein
VEVTLAATAFNLTRMWRVAQFGARKAEKKVIA